MKGDDIAARFVTLAVTIIKVVDALPDTLAGKHIAGQLLRCGTSPGANYEEARGAESKRNFLHKLGITLKELQESRYWLAVVWKAELVSAFSIGDIVAEVDELCRIVGTSQRTARMSTGRRS